MVSLYIGICFLFIFSKTQLIRPARIITITPRPVCMYPARIIPACRYSSNPARAVACVSLLYCYYIYDLITLYYYVIVIIYIGFIY